ncbi:MAG: hypothetical protein APR63_05685 [Desulfuromonas sp. SDB]|nr:MAG: hypothetical protein APR63_05685 [Desulfuromonas sp. SDB]
MEYDYLYEMYKIPKKKINQINNETELISVVFNDFNVQNAKNFISYSDLSLNEISQIVPVSLSTLQRTFKNKKKLNSALSEVFIELGEIYKIGLQAFDGNKERLNEYLHTENPYFNHKRPLDIMNTHKGRDLVKDELLRIEYSGFS